MQDFFKIFDLAAKYDIDKSEIESKYFELLGKYHPDKATSDEQRAKFSQLSSIINDGYNVLLDDFKRAAHLLELNNININDDALAPKLPEQILADILEIQEALESNPDRRDEILAGANLQKKKLIFQLSELFLVRDYKSAALKAMYLKYLCLL